MGQCHEVIQAFYSGGGGGLQSDAGSVLLINGPFRVICEYPEIVKGEKRK